MSQGISFVEHRSGQRYEVSLPVRAEWDEADTERHVFTEGVTQNIGPHGALIHLQELPSVGSRLRLAVMDPEAGPQIEVLARVLRLERNPSRSLAAIDLLEAEEKWRITIWEAARSRSADN